MTLLFLSHEVDPQTDQPLIFQRLRKFRITSRDSAILFRCRPLLTYFSLTLLAHVSSGTQEARMDGNRAGVRGYCAGVRGM